MIFELEKACYPKITSLFEDFSHYLAINSLIAGMTPGKAWANNRVNPKSALLWDMVNTFFFLAGDTSNTAFNEELNSLIANKIVPEAKNYHYDRFYLQYAPSSWEDVMEKILPGTGFKTKKIHFYTFFPQDLPKIRNWKEKIPSGLQMKKITNELLDSKSLSNVEEVNYCIKACWRSIERYLQEGIGFCLLDHEEILSWCSTDYVTDGEWELYLLAPNDRFCTVFPRESS